MINEGSDGGLGWRDGKERRIRDPWTYPPTAQPHKGAVLMQKSDIVGSRIFQGPQL